MTGYALARVLEAGADQDTDVDQAGVLLTNAVKIKLSQPGSGRWYRSRGSNAAHRASAPGEPPAVDLGTYRAAWTWRSRRVAPSVWEVLVYPDHAHLQQHGEPAELGLFLEFGTRRMAARPHLRPAVAETLPLLGHPAAAGITRRQQREARR